MMPYPVRGTIIRRAAMKILMVALLIAILVIVARSSRGEK
jgi:hypothetical protein